jgi:hypothetical protein
MRQNIARNARRARSGRFAFSFWIAALAAGCASLGPPRDVNDICDIFDDRSRWLAAAEAAEQDWGAPVAVQMAIIWRESSFRADAQPPRRHVLWVIPWGRASTAYGYAQALDGTWDDYRAATGNRGADRDDFADSTDFVGWYMAQTTARNGVPAGDAYNQYLAYHEGQTGYRRGSYRGKPQLLAAARQVADQAARYERQLSACRASL